MLATLKKKMDNIENNVIAFAKLRELKHLPTF